MTAASLARGTIVFAVTSAYLGYVFQIHDPFWRAGLGDWLDPYFINSLLEWWYQAARRFENPASPPVFHPAAGTLGYSHGLILFAPFYWLPRLLWHPFQAHNAAVFLAVLVGTLTLYVFFRRALALRFAESFALTLFFASSPNVLDGGLNVWTQRASVFLVPPILLIATAAHRADGPRALALGFIAGLLATLMWTQDFYSAQFTLFFAGVGLLPWLLRGAGQRVRRAAPWRRSTPLARILLMLGVLGAIWTLLVFVSGGWTIHVAGIRIRSTDPWRPGALAAVSLAAFGLLRGGWRLSIRAIRPRPMVLAATAGAALGTVIFLSIYLPAYRLFPGFAEEEYLRVLRPRRASDLTNPVRFISTHEGFNTLRPFILLLSVVVIAWLPGRRGSRGLPRTSALLWLLVALLVFLIPFRFGELSAWGALFRPLPGFNAIRDPLRIIYQFELAVVIAAGFVLARLRDQPGVRWTVTLLACALIALSPNRTVFSFDRPNEQFDKWVAAPVRVDPSCRSFYMRQGPAEYRARSPEPWTLYSNDAAFLALRLQIPTLHGVSAWAPPSWNVTHPEAPGFSEAVRDWVARNGLTDVCAFDLERRTLLPE